MLICLPNQSTLLDRYLAFIRYGGRYLHSTEQKTNRKTTTAAFILLAQTSDDRRLLNDPHSFNDNNQLSASRRTFGKVRELLELKQVCGWGHAVLAMPTGQSV